MQKTRNRRKAGYIFLEMIIGVIIFAIAGYIILSSAANNIYIFRQNLDKEQKKRFEILKAAVYEYNYQTDRIPTSINDVKNLLNPDQYRDIWGRDYVFFSPVNYNGTFYDLVILSKGLNGNLDSLYNNSTHDFSPQKDDLYVILNVKDAIQSKHDITIERLSQAQAALNVYRDVNDGDTPGCTIGSTNCVVTLVREGFLKGKDAYDAWGSLFVYTGTSFKSCGPDKSCGTPDDVFL